MANRNRRPDYNGQRDYLRPDLLLCDARGQMAAQEPDLAFHRYER